MMKDGKRIGSLQITCPEISCELHHFPQEHCKVQTLFMYHGVTCKSCVEDICHGSQLVPDSLIGDAPKVQNLHKVDNFNADTPKHKQKLNIVNYINKLWSLFGISHNVENLRNRLGLGNVRTRNNQQMQGHGMVTVTSKGIDSLKPKSQIKCPEIECHHHHQPKAHCMVNSYFIYHGRKCMGCIEDICLGSHTVAEMLKGKNNSKDAPYPEKLPLRDQGIGDRIIAGDWQSGHPQPPLLKKHGHARNGHITQEPHHPNHHQEFTDRIFGNWRPRHSQTPLPVRHIQNINGQINHENILPNQHQGTRRRLLSVVWRSRNPQPFLTERGVQNSNGQFDLSGNRILTEKKITLEISILRGNK
ncbi:unnamed protein product [Mytilus coruscus]|uniref:Uncharacterized protein n=1 Tax=Mytilus coruscus TaxID=42192 RepID=A0A6J8AYP0_MYTCO|nr:unnamed protein product [Mytilus coruscus]